MIYKNQILDTFIKLVKIDSLSGQEKQMAKQLKKELRNLNCKVEEDDAGEKIGGNCGNIIAELPGHEELPSILLSAHMDRVKPGTKIKPDIVNDYIVSKSDTILGADDIAGVTGILEALRIINKKNVVHGDLKIIFTVAEEQGLLGAKNLDSDHYQDLDYGLVFDAAGSVGHVLYKGPTKYKFNASIRGESAHAALSPGKGINAIKISSLAISSMNLGEIDDDTTANIGVIRGGVARNIVPDFVELQGEVRSHNQKKLTAQVEHMKKMICKYINKYKGEKEFDIELLYKKFSLDLDDKLPRLLSKAARNTKKEVKFVKSCGGNDANIYNDCGLPSVSLAVGAENVHSRDERINIRELINLVDFTVKIIKTSREFV